MLHCKNAIPLSALYLFLQESASSCQFDTTTQQYLNSWIGYMVFAVIELWRWGMS